MMNNERKNLQQQQKKRRKYAYMYNPIEKKGKSLMIASEEDADYNKHAS